MDQSLLVKNGEALLVRLDREGMRPSAAAWFFDPDLDRWTLWIVPDVPPSDARDFYMRVSQSLWSEPEIDLSTSSVHMASADHPALVALARRYRTAAKPVLFLSSQMLDGFFAPEVIVLRMPKDLASRAA